MSLSNWLRGVLDLQPADSLDSVKFSLVAPWVQQSRDLLVIGLVLLWGAAIVFYVRYQPRVSRRRTLALTLARAALLSLLLVALAEPVLLVRATKTARPQLAVLIDGSQSMAIADEHAAEDRFSSTSGAASGQNLARRRVDCVSAWLTREEHNPLEQLAERFQVQTYLFAGPRDLQALPREEGGLSSAALTPAGPATALGQSLEELGQRRRGQTLAGVIMISDFCQNSGMPPTEVAEALGVPIHTVGVGASQINDLEIGLQSPPVMKLAEQSPVTVTVRQSGFSGESARLRVTARALPRGGSEPNAAEALEIHAQELALSGPSAVIECGFTPPSVGRWELVAEIEPPAGDEVADNNRATREVSVRDDFLRLLFVEHEPTWEWRFIKEVFHRDKLVGMRGFRTFLGSADPRVSASNELFVGTMAPQRSEFFANDVILVGGLPRKSLSPRFCQLLREFVGTFGGGLVVMVGPNHGPSDWIGTPLADMLPVVPLSEPARREASSYALRFTPAAESTDFMRLGSTPEESRQAWENLGPLAWYQAVARLHPLAVALAEHPRDRCDDGRTPQPIVALRRFGRGEVVYLGCNEFWRLRRAYGERYYRQFWGQMIHRLGLSHALGGEKRFRLASDRPAYAVEEQATIQVEAYDLQYLPLTAESLPEGRLECEVLTPQAAAEDTPKRLALSMVAEGRLEATLPLPIAGKYVVRLADPLTRDTVETSFVVEGASPELRRRTRDVVMQQSLARATGGQTCELAAADDLLKKLQAEPVRQAVARTVPLWDTWLAFVLVVGFMLGEWSLRKWAHLP